MSHRQAQVESGFSMIVVVILWIKWTEIIVENMNEESVVAQRQVYDAISAAGDVMSVQITPQLMSPAQSAHTSYIERLRQRKSEISEEERREAEKRKNAMKLKELKAKKARLADESAKEQQELNDEIERLSRF